MSEEELNNNWELYFSENKEYQLIALLNFYRLSKEPSEFISKMDKMGVYICFKKFLEKLNGGQAIGGRKTVILYSFNRFSNWDKINIGEYNIMLKDNLLSIIPFNINFGYMSANFLHLPEGLSYENTDASYLNNIGFTFLRYINSILKEQFYGILMNENRLPNELM